MTTKTAKQTIAVWSDKEFRRKCLTPTEERHNRTTQAGYSQDGQPWPASFSVVGSVSPSADDDNLEFEQYLAEQAAATGTPIETLRKMEADARERIGQTSPSREKLRSLAERTTPPAKYLEGDEPCPF